MSQGAAHTSISCCCCDDVWSSKRMANAAATDAYAREPKAQRVASTAGQVDWHEGCATHHGVGSGAHLQLHSWLRRLRGLLGGVHQSERSSSENRTRALV